MLDPLEPWGLDLVQYHHDKSIPGSPERCVSRSVVEDGQQRLWLLERIAVRQVEHRRRIARTLHTLSEAGMPRLVPYRRDEEGEFVSDVMGLSWQLSPYYESDTLPRPAYLSDAQRGRELASFLCDLRKFSVDLPCEDNSEPPDLQEYIAELVCTVNDREPLLYERIAPLLEKLVPFLESCSSLPKSFSHGDFHPLNILWNGQNAGAVIDWEFCGLLPETYDMANLIGCAGFEHPSALEGDFVAAFVMGMKDSGVNKESIRSLSHFVCALRFAWLSEWLRKDDRDMLDMELDYMSLLLENYPSLEARWMELFAR